MQNIGYIYRITNIVNGKTYIGKHVSKKNENFSNYFGSGVAIANAIRCYGKENFSKEILEWVSSKEELRIREIEWIGKENLNGHGEYNIKFTEKDIPNEWMKRLDNFPILNWYFEDQLTTREIADKIGCSQPLIVHFLSDKKDSDSRFVTVIQRQPLRKRTISQDALDRASITKKSKQKIVCDLCLREFSYLCISVHKISCSSVKTCECGVHPINSNLKLCVNCGAKIIRLKERRPSSVPHVRWHKNRNIFKEDCNWCKQEKL